MERDMNGIHHRSLLLALTLAALAALGTFSSASLASSSAGGNSARSNARLAGPEKTAIPYTASYIDERFGPVECIGVHQTNSVKYPGTETSGGRDKFKCKSTVAKTLLTGTSPEEVLTFGPSGQAWNSDYFAVAFSLAVPAISGTGLTSKNGKAYSAIIYY
jgi:hypothetical protein